jgi:transposase
VSVDVTVLSRTISIYLSSYIYQEEEKIGFITPRRNATLNGSQKWKDTMFEIVVDTMNYFGKYHRRNNSE